MTTIEKGSGDVFKDIGVKKKKFTKAQIKKLSIFWKSQLETTARYRENIYAIEEVMEKSLGIEGLEFFFADGEIVGIGTTGRDYELLQLDTSGDKIITIGD